MRLEKGRELERGDSIILDESQSLEQKPGGEANEQEGERDSRDQGRLTAHRGSWCLDCFSHSVLLCVCLNFVSWEECGRVRMWGAVLKATVREREREVEGKGVREKR